MEKTEQGILRDIVASLPAKSVEELDDMRRLAESLPPDDPRVTILPDIEAEIAGRYAAAHYAVEATKS